MNTTHQQSLTFRGSTWVKILGWSILLGMSLALLLIFRSPSRFKSTYENKAAFPAPQRLLVVFAHADDEVTNAGLIRHWASAGSEIRLLTLTDGSANPDSDLSSCAENETIVACRLRELQTSARKLGVRALRTPQLPDSKLMEHLPRAVDFVREELQTFQPDALLTMEPSGLNGLTDHRAAFLSVAQALSLSPSQARVYLSTLPPPFSWVLRSEIPPQYNSKLATFPLISALIEIKSGSALAHASQSSTIRGLTLGLGPQRFFSWINFETYGVFESTEIPQLTSK